MKKLLKKSKYLVLALVLALAMGIPVLAECFHRKGPEYYEMVPGTARYHSFSKCEAKYTVHWECQDCHKLFTEINTVTLYTNHEYKVYTATCDGATQSWRERCAVCGHEIITYHPCPKGPHSGSCTVLPASVTPGTEIK